MRVELKSAVSALVDKVRKAADEKFISSYRAEIYIQALQDAFFKLIKVEIK